MADEMVFGIRIRGNAAGAVNAVNQAVGAFQKLDAKMRQMANRTIGAMAPQNVNFGNLDQLKNSKEIGDWQQRQELALLRTRLENAKSVFTAQKAAADKYYNDVVVPQEKKVQALREKIAQKKAAGQPTKRLDNSLAKQDAKLADYQAVYQAKTIKAEQALHNAVAAYARKSTQIVKAEYKAREAEAQRSAAAQAAAHKKLVQQQQSAARGLVAGVNGAFNSLKGSLGEFTNATRLLSQGFSEITRTLTMFVAVPLGAFLGASTRAAMDFESAMVRVGKTTELLDKPDQFKALTQSIRDIAKYTSSSHVELAAFAEQFGQVGVTNTNALERLIYLSEKLVTATDLTADTVAKDMGRIAAAFGLNLNTEKGVDTLERMGDVINKLENTTAASAGEIVEGLLNVASLGGMLDMPIQDMAAVVAMMESMGVAADAVGNRLNRFYQQMIDKPKEMAKMMAGFTSSTGRFYETADDVMEAITNKDQVIPLLQDVVEAMANVNDESRAKALREWFDVFGQVGGKVGVLAGNTAGLGRALADAREEFEKGGSLFYEYDKALMTSDAHMKIMRNNINDVAVTVGATFLPVLNRLIEYAIPGIQMLSKAFESLTWESKLLVVGLPILSVVLLPLLFIFTQLAHGASMVFMGFRTLVTASMGLGSAVFGIVKIGFSLVKMFGALSVAGGGFKILAGGLGSTLLSLGGGFLGVALAIGAVVGGAGLVLKRLESMGVDVAGFFTDLAEKAKTWGENMMITFSGGMIGGALNYLAQALASIANMIAGFFEAHSPPKKGPLRTIDQWGSSLFTTYLRGFKNADFGILSEVGGMIRSILNTMFTGEGAEEHVNGILARAREGIAQLISIFNQTGKVAEDVLNDIVGNLGEIGPEVAKMLRLWLQYEQTQKRIKQLEAERAQANKDYGDEVAAVAASSISAEEKANKIRTAVNKRNSAVARIDKETEAEQEKADALKEQLDWQKSFIQAQIDQADIFASIAKAIEKVGGALENLAGGKGFGDQISEDIEEAKKKIDDTMTTIRKRIESAREALLAFFKGMRGEDMMPAGAAAAMPYLMQHNPEGLAEMQKTYEWGQKVYKLLHPTGGGEFTMGLEDSKGLAALQGALEGFGQAIEETVANVTAVLSTPEVKKALDTLFGSEAQGNIEETRKGWRQFGYGLGIVLGSVIMLGAMLVNVVAWLINLPERLSEHFKITGDINTFLVDVKNQLMELGKGVLAIIINGLTTGDTGWVTTLREYLSTKFGEIASTASEWGENLVKTYGEGLLTGANTWWAEKIAAAAQWIADFLEPHSPPKMGPLSTIDQWGMKLVQIFADGIVAGLSTIGEKVTQVGDKIGEYLNVAAGTVLGPLANIFDWGKNLIGVFADGIVAGAGAVGEKLSQVGQSIADYLQPHSPPKVGPLSTIDSWGEALLALFLGGFTEGDFNPISLVATKIGEALSGLFSGGTGEGPSVGFVTAFVGMLDEVIAVLGEKIPAIQDLWTQLRDLPVTLFGAGYGETYMLPILTSLWVVIDTWFITNTPLMLLRWITFRDTFMVAFAELYPKVALVFASLMFNPEVAAAMLIAQGQFYNKGAEFASAVGMGINGMAGAVIGEMSALVDGLIAQIDRAIAAVDMLIDALDNLDSVGGVSVGVGLGGLGGNRYGEETGMASGGIATRPTRTWIAEGGEPEAVIPLSRLPTLLGDMVAAPDNTQVVVQINNPDFRDDDNVREVVREVRKTLTAAIRDQKRMRGRS